MGETAVIVAGFDIGGTKSAALLADVREGAIEFLAREQIPTTPDRNAVLDRLAEAVREAEKRTGAKAECAGISCGGPLSSKEGILLDPPNLVGWHGAHLTEYIAEATGLPIAKVKLKNDADACALAEWKYGAGVGTKNMIFLTFGTGIGAGLILNGALYSGACDQAGEIGHVRMERFGPVGFGKVGSFEGFCSGGGIAQLAEAYFLEKRQRGEPCPSGCITAKELGEMAEKGDKDALAIFETVGEYFGRGLSILVDVLNPELIVAGSVFTRCRKFLEPAMRRAMERECLPMALSRVRVTGCALKEQIGDYGAIAAALF